MNNFDWFGLAAAITYAHVEAQGYKVSGSALKSAERVSVSDKLAPITAVCSSEVHRGVKPLGNGRDAANQNSRPCADSQVSASTSPASGARPATLAGEGEVHASVASPSFQGLTIERLISDTERIQDATTK